MPRVKKLQDKNLPAIKRIDPFAESVVTASSHVSLFNFDFTENKWLKTEVEGPLFVYKRIEAPFHSFMIANRQSLSDFIEPICKTMKLRYEPPYVYVYNINGTIKGLWISGEDECKRIFSLLSLLCESCKNSVDCGSSAGIISSSSDGASDSDRRKEAISSDSERSKGESIKGIASGSEQMEKESVTLNSRKTIGAATESGHFADSSSSDSELTMDANNIASISELTLDDGIGLKMNVDPTRVPCDAEIKANTSDASDSESAEEGTTTMRTAIDSSASASSGARIRSNQISIASSSKTAVKECSAPSEAPVKQVVVKASKKKQKRGGQKNLEAIQEIDPFAESLVTASSHVSLFNFDVSEKRWLKTDVEGPLFVYKRIDFPFYSFMVMSRVGESATEFVEPLRQSLDLRYESPYIFVYKPDGWFYYSSVVKVDVANCKQFLFQGRLKGFGFMTKVNAERSTIV